MTDTPRLALPVIEAAQAQKHVTHNEALVLLDALTQLTVESRDLTAPPGSPAEGACYIPAAGASGDWSGWDGEIALYSGGGWQPIAPVPGMNAWVKAERATVTYEDGVWRDGIALTASGGRVTLRAKEEELTLSGAFVETADTAFIPDRAVVLGVASRTTEEITGATSYAVGTAANTTQFGDLLNIALDGNISYIVLKNSFRYYMTFEGGALVTSKQLELFGSRQSGRPANVWDRLFIEGKNIANVLFDSGPEIKAQAEGRDVLNAAFQEAILRATSEAARRARA